MTQTLRQSPFGQDALQLTAVQQAASDQLGQQGNAVALYCKRSQQGEVMCHHARLEAHRNLLRLGPVQYPTLRTGLFAH